MPTTTTTTTLTADPEVDDSITLDLAVMRAKGTNVVSVVESTCPAPEWAPWMDGRYLTITTLGRCGVFTLSGPRGHRADDDDVWLAVEAGVPADVAEGAR